MAIHQIQVASKDIRCSFCGRNGHLAKDCKWGRGSKLFTSLMKTAHAPRVISGQWAEQPSSFWMCQFCDWLQLVIVNIT